MYVTILEPDQATEDFCYHSYSNWALTSTVFIQNLKAFMKGQKGGFMQHNLVIWSCKILCMQLSMILLRKSTKFSSL
ncbi:hypothetical protein C8J55DRAFT_529243 [Lentinula edodes]|uniref:Uncharacterized protein n=1 Tax=Lentinula lateritia TaxID=40482 RepID=A0A9W8ZRM6_9AGAR|nr:hypothetical protein C8J55DRAFT_529243 [Lentinula edodes]